MARPLLALGGVVLIGVGVAIAFGWGLGSAVERDTTVAQQIRGVKLDADSGDVRIRTGSGPITVHQKLHYNFRSEPGDAWRVDGDQLVLGDCGRNCTADFEIVVPAGLPVTGKADSGSLDIAGVGSVDVTADSGHAQVANVTGPVNLRLDSGSIDLHDVGPVQLHSDSGHVSADGVRGPVDISADSGRVELALASPNDVRVKADSGSVDVRVPAGSYRVIGDTDSGHRSVLIPQYTQNTGGADTKTLDLTTESGSVTVTAA
ncbi:DUF4097 family beta strand repeat-containing protein [Amycolatopsis sp. NPDC051903]|uniref:DUF4097 family beta strand repeat-containing protein n=1 Tax=Amycolatopsis sp. NPDC051903 TaxID=3363936 RepID=UPI0037B15C5C